MENNTSNDTVPTKESVSNAQEELETQDTSITQEDDNDIFDPIPPNKPNRNKKDISATKPAREQKFPRINIAFSPDNLEYLHIVSRIEGVSITEYVNMLINKNKSDRAIEVEQARKILKNIK